MRSILPLSIAVAMTLGLFLLQARQSQPVPTSSPIASARCALVEYATARCPKADFQGCIALLHGLMAAHRAPHNLPPQHDDAFTNGYEASLYSTLLPCMPDGDRRLQVITQLLSSRREGGLFVDWGWSDNFTNPPDTSVTTFVIPHLLSVIDCVTAGDREQILKRSLDAIAKVKSLTPGSGIPRYRETEPDEGEGRKSRKHGLILCSRLLGLSRTEPPNDVSVLDSEVGSAANHSRLLSIYFMGQRVRLEGSRRRFDQYVARACHNQRKDLIDKLTHPSLENDIGAGLLLASIAGYYARPPIIPLARDMALQGTATEDGSVLVVGFPSDATLLVAWSPNGRSAVGEDYRYVDGATLTAGKEAPPWTVGGYYMSDGRLGLRPPVYVVCKAGGPNLEETVKSSNGQETVLIGIRLANDDIMKAVQRLMERSKDPADEGPSRLSWRNSLNNGSELLLSTTLEFPIPVAPKGAIQIIALIK